MQLLDRLQDMQYIVAERKAGHYAAHLEWMEAEALYGKGSEKSLEYKAKKYAIRDMLHEAELELEELEEELAHG